MADTPTPPTVVLVDDEDIVLSSLASLLALETDYAVETFNTPAAAIEYARNGRATVVVSDYLMPGTNGIELLAVYRDLQPQAPRILLTGYADKENAIKAINEVGLFQYIEKPWDNDHLLLVLRNAIERTELLASLQSRIDEVNSAYNQLKGLKDDILRTFI